MAITVDPRPYYSTPAVKRKHSAAAKQMQISCNTNPWRTSMAVTDETCQRRLTLQNAAYVDLTTCKSPSVLRSDDFASQGRNQEFDSSQRYSRGCGSSLFGVA